MGTCDIPGCGGDDTLSFTCNECGNTYCASHRLPEAHYCRELRADDLSWPVEEESSRGSPSGEPKPLDTDSLPTAKTDSDTSKTSFRRNEECAICGDSFLSISGCQRCAAQVCRSCLADDKHDCPQDEESSTSDDSEPVYRRIGGLGSTTNTPNTPDSDRTRRTPGRLRRLATAVWRYKLLVLLVALAVLGGVAFGPLSFATVLPGDIGQDIDRSLKSAGNEAERLVSDVTDTSLNATKVETLVHERINEIRKNRGLPPLNHDSTLQEIASEYSQAMATKGFYGHTSPSGETFEDRYREEGFNCRIPVGNDRYVTGAENIQYTFAFVDVRTANGTVYYSSEKELARGLVRAWMNSKGHRESILKPYWNNQGIGVYIIENPNGAGVKVYATQNFC